MQRVEYKEVKKKNNLKTLKKNTKAEKVKRRQKKIINGIDKIKVIEVTTSKEMDKFIDSNLVFSTSPFWTPPLIQEELIHLTRIKISF